jgi:hypothetical protein
MQTMNREAITITDDDIQYSVYPLGHRQLYFG